MKLLEADKLFATPARMKALEGLLDDKNTLRIAIDGLRGSAPALLLAALKPRRRLYWWWLTTSIRQVISITTFARLLTKRRWLFSQVVTAAILSMDSTTLLRRFYARRLSMPLCRKNHPVWVVTYPEALAEKVPSKKTLTENTLDLTAGRKADMTKVKVRLRELGFGEVDYVYEPGQFAVRGSILDVYSFSR